ncbi:hypothetical protein ACKWTF_016042 [Chironomus riparius]
MGAFQSRSNDFQLKYKKFQLIIDFIESEHPIKVHNNLANQCNLASSEQLEAFGIIIYEKAVLNPNLSLKCAQFVKQLENEIIFDNGQIHIFSSTFNQYLMKLIHSIIENYDDSKMTDCAVELGKNIATFIGHLFNVDSLDIKFLIEFVQTAKLKETKKNKFFMKKIWHVVAKKIQASHGMTYEIFDETITDSLDERNRNSMLHSKYNEAEQSINDLAKSVSLNRYEFHEHIDDFVSMPEESLKMLVASFLSQTIIKPKLINVYYDNTLKIYNIRPIVIKETLEFFFNDFIKRYQVITNLGIVENWDRFYNLGTIIIQFFNIGLTRDAVLEKFMNFLKSYEFPIELFNAFFTSILIKYRGQLLQSYLKHVKKYTTNPISRTILIPAFEEYINCNELQRGKTLKHKNVCERSVADLPDFHEYASKCQTLKEAFKSKRSQKQPTFV